MRKIGMACVLLVAACGCGIEGLHNANPTTRIQADAGGFSFSNNKDVSLKLDEGRYSPASKELELKKLEITDNASNVRRANEIQMEGMAKQAEANWNGAISFIEKMPDLISKFTPWVRPEYKEPLSMPTWLGGLLLLLIGVPLALLLVFAVLLVVWKAARAAYSWATTKKTS